MCVMGRKNHPCACGKYYKHMGALMNHIRIKHEMMQVYKVKTTPKTKGRPKKEDKQAKDLQMERLQKEQNKNEKLILQQFMGKDFFIMEALEKQFSQTFIIENRQNLSYNCKTLEQQEEDIMKCMVWLSEMLENRILIQNQEGRDLQFEIDQFIELIPIIKCSEVETLFESTFISKIMNFNEQYCYEESYIPDTTVEVSEQQSNSNEKNDKTEPNRYFSKNVLIENELAAPNEIIQNGFDQQPQVEENNNLVVSIINNPQNQFINFERSDMFSENSFLQQNEVSQQLEMTQSEDMHYQVNSLTPNPQNQFLQQHETGIHNYNISLYQNEVPQDQIEMNNLEKSQDEERHSEDSILPLEEMGIFFKKDTE